MTEANDLLSIAKMGVDAESFLQTPLGRFLMKKAKDEEAAALAELVDADPEDVKENREIRNRIHVVKMFRQWMTEAIEVGHAAHMHLKQLEDMERHGV